MKLGASENTNMSEIYAQMCLRATEGDGRESRDCREPSITSRLGLFISDFGIDDSQKQLLTSSLFRARTD